MQSYKNNDKLYHEQYLFSANFTMNEVFCFSMHLLETRLELHLHVSRLLLVQFLLWQCFRVSLFCKLLMVCLDWCELSLFCSTNFERSSWDNFKKYFCGESFDPIPNLCKMRALIAAKSNMLKKIAHAT